MGRRIEWSRIVFVACTSECTRKAIYGTSSRVAATEDFSSLTISPVIVIKSAIETDTLRGSIVPARNSKATARRVS